MKQVLLYFFKVTFFIRWASRQPPAALRRIHVKSVIFLFRHHFRLLFGGKNASKLNESRWAKGSLLMALSGSGGKNHMYFDTLSLSLITYARLCSTYKPRKHERSFSVDWIIVYLMSVWLEWIAAYVEKATTRFFPLSSIYLSIYCSLPSADKTTRRKIENKHETHTHTREHKNFKTNETIIKNLHLDTFVPPSLHEHSITLPCSILLYCEEKKEEILSVFREEKATPRWMDASKRLRTCFC